MHTCTRQSRQEARAPAGGHLVTEPLCSLWSQFPLCFESSVECALLQVPRVSAVVTS